MLIAKKPCSFAGKKYLIGDPIPDGVVQAITRLKESGHIAEVDGEGPLLPSSTSLEELQGVEKKHTMNSLMKLNREKLIELAKEFDIEVNEEPKKEIAELILEKQGE